ncbi:MAG: RDD family protein [Candidatus Omnitrophica bacterium]|nr:RDD family protein [Candidatus Omnitrophota bacterium]
MDFSKPGPNKRVCAFFIDSIIAQFIAIFISVLLGKNFTWAIWIIVILFKDCFNGQSAGKYLVGIQVIGEDGLPAKSAKTIIRNILMVIPVLPLIEYIVMLKDKVEAKRFGDRIAKTKVNDLKPQAKDSTFLWISIALLVAVIVLKIAIGFMAISAAERSGLLKR